MTAGSTLPEKIFSRDAVRTTTHPRPSDPGYPITPRHIDPEGDWRVLHALFETFGFTEFGPAAYYVFKYLLREESWIPIEPAKFQLFCRVEQCGVTQAHLEDLVRAGVLTFDAEIGYEVTHAAIAACFVTHPKL